MITDLMHHLTSDGYMLAGMCLKQPPQVGNVFSNHDDDSGWPMGVATIVKASRVIVDGVKNVIFRDRLAKMLRVRHVIVRRHLLDPSVSHSDCSTPQDRRNRRVSKTFLPTADPSLGEYHHPNFAISTTLQRYDCAVMTKLRSRSGSVRLLLSNVHLYWNPRPRGVKPLQAWLAHSALLAFGASPCPSYAADEVCMVGDFNSDVCSPGTDDGAIALLMKGSLSTKHDEHPVHAGCDRADAKRDWDDMKLRPRIATFRSAYESVFDAHQKSLMTKKLSSSSLSPTSSVFVPSSASSTSSSTATTTATTSRRVSKKANLVTTRTSTYEGWIDHILIGRSVSVQGTLSLPYDPCSRSSLSSFGPIPSRMWPSDHIPLGAILGSAPTSTTTTDDIRINQDETKTSRKNRFETSKGALLFERERLRRLRERRRSRKSSDSAASGASSDSTPSLLTLDHVLESSPDEDDVWSGSTQHSMTLVPNVDDTQDDNVELANALRKGHAILGRIMSAESDDSNVVRTRRSYSAPSFNDAAMSRDPVIERMSRRVRTPRSQEMLSLFRRAIGRE